MIDPASSMLLTDLYQLTMLQGYLEHGMHETAVFEFFVRKLPPGRNFLLAAGLEQVLDYLEHARFTPDDLQWLAQRRQFGPKLLEFAEAFRFTGDVDALREGTVFFPDEPVIRVVAPICQAQLIESRLINLIHLQTLIASKAVRSVLAAPSKLLVDFGMRRAHGAEAGLLAARAAYLAGFAGTATVMANMLWNVPVYGTMAHSFIQAHDDETAAFTRFAHANSGDVVLLIDTYDTEAAAVKIVVLAKQLRSQGIAVHGVRLDSGDLAEHARRVRRILDEGGLAETTIFASGNLDEHALAKLVASGAPIDGYGVGTRVDVSVDAPYLDCAYKLQEYAGGPRRKHSEGKATWPGRRQIFRRYDADGRLLADEVSLESDPRPGEALLVPVMRTGRRLSPPDRLADLRACTLENLERLPLPLKSLESASPYDVFISPSLRELADELDRAMSARW
ncbi:MAG TPA: nicotinate phosphoribosyltransferase [Pirellulales bacterium]|jgi:nicotinate phosphoribosyltransferase|nr:nicotinate phosphoribosyltransferase [Pirellulales bacterium]